MKPYLSPTTGARGWLVTSIIVSSVMLSSSASGAPVTQEQAGRAVATFIVKRYPTPAKTAALTVTSIGSSHLAIQQVEPWIESGQTIGYVATLNPSGYVLFSTDDEAPPIKLYTDQGDFWKLPPGLLRVLKLELSEDLSALASMRKNTVTTDPKYSRQWSALSDPQKHPADLKEAGAFAAGEVLVRTSWNQDSPYNHYCPDGPSCDPGIFSGCNGRAYAGCVACAVSQILRYWKQPVVVAQDHTHTDPGACSGTHSIHDAGMGPYAWNNMSNSIDDDSPNSEKGAISQLMYHAAIALDSDFGADSTSAYPTNVAQVFTNFFSYTCNELEGHSWYTSPQWYNKISVDIDAHRPIYYAMWANTDWDDGHSVVCDGYRNGDEIHLNLGWSGTGTAWYNIDRVYYDAPWPIDDSTWTVHWAVFAITPPFIYVDGSYTGGDTVPFKTVTKASEAVLGHTTIRVYAGNYPETPTLSNPATIDALNGMVTIGSP